MICFTVGAPTLFADWCEEVCAQLVTRVSGRPEIIPANTLEEVAAAMIRAQSDSVILQARQPTEALRATLVASGRAFLVVIDDPFAVFTTLTAGCGIEPVAATRMTATSYAALVEYSAAATAVVLRSDRHAGDPIAAARLIAEQLGLPLSAAEITEAVAGVPPYATEAWSDGIARSCPGFAIGALQGYRDYFAGRGWSNISWSRELFLLGDDPRRSADGVLDLTGAIRALLFGPFIALPFGSWRCGVTLAVSKEAAGLGFSVEALVGPRFVSIAAATAAPDEQGVCRVTLSFVVDPHTDQPVSLRIINLQPATSGLFALVEVVLARHAGVASDIPAELSAALGL
jgi:hypothetical protein